MAIGKTLNGRQIAFLVWDKFRRDSSEVGLTEFFDLREVRLANDDLTRFMRDWDEVMFGLLNEQDPKYLLSLFDEQVKRCSHFKQVYQGYQTECRHRGLEHSYENLRIWVQAHIDGRQQEKLRAQLTGGVETVLLLLLMLETKSLPNQERVLVSSSLKIKVVVVEEEIALFSTTMISWVPMSLRKAKVRANVVSLRRIAVKAVNLVLVLRVKGKATRNLPVLDLEPDLRVDSHKLLGKIRLIPQREYEAMLLMENIFPRNHVWNPEENRPLETKIGHHALLSCKADVIEIGVEIGILPIVNSIIHL